MDRHIRIGMLRFNFIDQRFGHLMRLFKIILASDFNMKIQKQEIADHPTSEIVSPHDRRMMSKDKHFHGLKSVFESPRSKSSETARFKI